MRLEICAKSMIFSDDICGYCQYWEFEDERRSGTGIERTCMRKYSAFKKYVPNEKTLRKYNQKLCILEKY